MGALVTWRKNNMKAADATVKKAAAEGMQDALDHILTEANKTVPHETGALLRSGDTDLDASAFKGTVYYGTGPATAYAVRQHEETGWKHNAGRRAKWLEATFKEEYPRIKHYIATKLKAVM